MYEAINVTQIGKRIKDLRIQKNMTAEDLGRLWALVPALSICMNAASGYREMKSKSALLNFSVYPLSPFFIRQNNTKRHK